MKRMVLWVAVVAILVLGVTPAQAGLRDQLPDDHCTSCLCNRTRCLDEADRLYYNCGYNAVSVWDFFGCETAYDLDGMGCSLEYLGCLNPV